MSVLPKYMCGQGLRYKMSSSCKYCHIYDQCCCSPSHIPSLSSPYSSNPSRGHMTLWFSAFLPSTFLKDLRNGPDLDYGYESRAFSATFKEALMDLSDAIYLWLSLTRKWLISVFSFGLVDKLSTITSVLQVSCNKVFFRKERGREGKTCIAALCIWKLLTCCSPFNIRLIYSANIF